MSLKEAIISYISGSESLVLATADINGQPQLRSIGGYGIEGLDIYFGTLKTSKKVTELEENPHVAVLFQHEGQVIPNFRNITVYGKAELLSAGSFDKGLEVIHSRRPQSRISTKTHNIYRIRTWEIKILDFSKEKQIEILNAYDIK